MNQIKLMKIVAAYQHCIAQGFMSRSEIPAIKIAAKGQREGLYVIAALDILASLRA